MSAQSESDIDRNSTVFAPMNVAVCGPDDTGDDDENTERFDADANEVDRIIYGNFSGRQIGGHFGSERRIAGWKIGSNQWLRFANEGAQSYRIFP